MAAWIRSSSCWACGYSFQDRQPRSEQAALLPWLAAVLLAGDWADPGWPATMEGATIAGERAAAAVLAG